MDPARITEILTDTVTVDLVERQPIMQIAYAAADGSPRAVPVGYLLREGKFLFFTIPSSDKVAALPERSNAFSRPSSVDCRRPSNPPAAYTFVDRRRGVRARAR
jgi:nitroimidazol reductase NimA-like FMN-containing flavoprotein (pyridoxamine 5'-phosphate oxidase superfamily)